MRRQSETLRTATGQFASKYEEGPPYPTTYVSWVSMRQRCLDSKCRSYKNYGGRGIKVCARWDTFTNFLSDMGLRPDGTSLDRIDVNGDYTPANCRWATKSEQQRNRRNNRPIVAFGETKLLIEWVEDERCTVTFSTLRNRLMKYGWDAERAIATPSRPKLPDGAGPRFSPLP